MRCKVRHRTRLPNGSLKQSEQEVTTAGPRLRLGRGTDNDVFLKDLAVAYRHADLVVRDFDIVVEAVAGGGAVLFDGVAAGRGVLTPDTDVGIGPYRLKLLPPEEGFDLVLEVEAPAPGTAAAAPAIPPGALRLRGGAFGRRPLSWLLFLLVLAGGLALPIAAHLSRDGEAPVSLADGRAGGDAPRPLLARLDQVWTSGELSDPHKFLGARCEACHVKAFERVANRTCGNCHGTIRHHFDAALQPAGGASPDQGPERCGACHAEHQGPDGLIPTHQALCTGCHADLPAHAQKPPLKNVRDFAPGDKGHPEFRPSVVTDPAGGRPERIEIGAPDLRESSGLRFNHVCHLGLQSAPPVHPDDPKCFSPDGTLPVAGGYPERDRADPTRYDGILEIAFAERDGQVRAKLGCGSCHVPEAGGAMMRPVDMERHCAYCHSLKFDSRQPDYHGDDGARLKDADRVLPHGKDQEVAAVLRDYFTAIAAQETPARTDATGQRRRAGPAAAEPPPAVSQASVQQRLASRMASYFADSKDSKCGKCHRTGIRQEGGKTAYDVLPVRVQHVWLPKARFDHGSHANVPCARCHDTAKSLAGAPSGSPGAGPTHTKVTLSTASGDVLLPPIGVCLECHRGEAASAAVPSTCTMCHVYHPARGTCPIVPGPSAAARGGDANCPRLPSLGATAGSAAD